MNEVILRRQTVTSESTVGELDVFGTRVFTLEDPPRKHKVYGETRIPSGSYTLNLRNEGGMTLRYQRRFPKMHEGMIWLRHVPMFEWVYIHIGNSPRDTEGCVLVGWERAKNRVYGSVRAYEAIYPLLVAAIKSEAGCVCTILD